MLKLLVAITLVIIVLAWLWVLGVCEIVVLIVALLLI